LTPVSPIDNTRVLNEKVTMVNDMLDFEVSSKILLGALYQMRVKHPLDYCFEALNIRLLTLNKTQREYKLIEQYMKNGLNHQTVPITKIFALERRGEAERISQWKDSKNRMYLWHGSKVLNFMGILSQGLRIAPPEAPATGYMFGKGIYFADTFAKSYAYCNDWSSRGTDGSKFLILCEVALGDTLDLFESNYITNLAAPYKSVKGCGRQGPDPAHNIVLANGAIVPLGTQINYEYKDYAGKRVNPALGYNEYIVYDISQVRMRYLVQVK